VNSSWSSLRVYPVRRLYRKALVFSVMQMVLHMHFIIFHRQMQTACLLIPDQEYVHNTEQLKYSCIKLLS
jgi:hypothetical protein